MKRILLILVATVLSQIGAPLAFAARSSNTSSSSPGSMFYGVENPEGSSHFYGAIGFFGVDYSHIFKDNDNVNNTPSLSGMLNIGGDYEYMLQTDFGVGGLFRYYSTSDDWQNNVTASYSNWVIGPYARFHFPNRFFDFFFGPGLGFGNPTGEYKTSATKTNLDAGTQLMPFYQMGVLIGISQNLAVGFETMRLLSLGRTINGWVQSDYTFKVRFSM